MKRLALIEVNATACFLPLENVLHILTGPEVFKLPLLRSCFAGLFLFREKLVPLLVDRHNDNDNDDNRAVSPPLILVCEAEYGLVGVPADKIVRLTNTGDVALESADGSPLQDKLEISGRDYHKLDLNQIMDCPGYTICGMLD